MRRFPVLTLVLLTAGVTAQTQDPPALDVVSIKRNTSRSGGMSMSSRPGGVSVMINGPISSIFGRAYPSDSRDIINAPDWLSTERYDVTARVTGNPTQEQRLELWRALFAERMKLKAHYETREFPTYALILARSDGRLGPRMQRTVDCAALSAANRADGATPPAPAITAVGVPQCGMRMGRDRLESGGILLASFADSISSAAGRTVFDKTGLEGFYEFTLEYAPQRLGAGGAPDERPDIFTALQEQLGLRLEPTRTAIQVPVIDHIERPTPD